MVVLVGRGLASESASLYSSSSSSSMGSLPPRRKSATYFENRLTAGFEVLMLPLLDTIELSNCFLPFLAECFRELFCNLLEPDSSNLPEEYCSSSESSSAS